MKKSTNQVQTRDLFIFIGDKNGEVQMWLVFGE